MPEEDTIGQIIRRDLDRLPMLPAERWLPQPPRRRRWMRNAAFVPATVLVVLAAIGVGLGLADWRAHRTAEEPQATSGGVPGPLALAGGAPSLGFGLVSTSANTLLVRNEVTEAAPLTFSLALPQVAVSPNGHDIAYWRVLPDRQTGQAIYELLRSDVLDPAVRDRVLMRAPSGEAPGPFIWSSDGTGLIANTHTPPTRGGDAGAATRPTHATWFTVDIASGKTEQLPQTFADSFSLVYAWDRSRDLVTGSTISFGSPSVAGGPTFLTFKAGVIQSHVVPTGGMIAAADAYGKSVVLEFAADCKPTPAARPCPTLEVRDQATFAITTSVPVAVATRDFADVVFRPRSQDLIVQIPLPNGDAQVELWTDLGRGPHQVLATYTQTVRFTGRRELVLPRVDGSAVFLLKFDGSAGGRWFGEIVGLYPIKGATGFERTPFEILTGGNPLASVVLDPAFAKALDPSRATPSPISAGAIPKCPAGQTPTLAVANDPPPGPAQGSGSSGAEAAFRKLRPDVKSFDMYPFGSDQKAQSPSDLGRGPVWIVAGDETFVAMVLGQPDGNNWFAYPAKFLGCRTAQPAPTPQSTGVVLDSRVGSGPDQPGLSRGIPSGTSRGPTSVAVGEDGRVYLWDQANGRVLVYDNGRLVSKVSVSVSREARELEVLNGKLYFALNASGTRQEWELDATSGATLRTIPPPLTGRQSTLYPTTRWTPATPTVNGVWPIGTDRYGNRYERFIDPTCSRGAAVCGEVRRRSATGSLLDTATEPAGIAVEDYYVARDGAVYELRSDRASNGDVAGIFVIRLMSALPVPHYQVGLNGQVRDYDRMRQDGVQRPGEPPLIPNDGNPPGSALVADALVRLEPYGIEARTDALGKFVFPQVDVPAPCRWVTVTVTKAGFGSYRMEFALYSPDVGVGLQLWLEHHDVDQRSGPPQAGANLGEAYCWR